MTCRPSNIGPAEGFSLLEALVALGIFGLSAVALMHGQGENVRSATALQNRILADIVAENVLVESYLQGPSSPLLQTKGRVDLAGRSWSWTRSVRASSYPSLQQIDIDVRVDGEESIVGSMTGFRRVQ